MRIKTTFFFLVFIGLFTSSFSQEFDKVKVEGKITIEKKDSFITIRGSVENKENFFVDELSYNLVAVKKDTTSNYSKNNQSSQFSLEPNQEKVLSTLRVNIKEGRDELKTYLFIKHKGKLLHRDTLFLFPKQQKKVVKKKSQEVYESEFLIKGIVIEEVLTRIGKDYHDFFYREYLVSGKKYPFIITIVEKPAMGSSSIISVEVNGQKIHEFFAKPQEEYLKSNVVSAMRGLKIYEKRRKSTSIYNKI